jgi:osmotically-inducible protein OsmY/sporulation protein YlmC with PRC-barrel domain
VRCQDGAAGRLKFVVVDPDDGEATDLIVERGALLHRDVVVPIGWVERATEDTIFLNARLDDLKALPEYDEVEFIQPDPTYRPISGHRVEETRIWIGPYLAIGGGRPWILHQVRLGIAEDEVLVRRGLSVQASDNCSAGVVDHLVIDPASKHVTHLVVRHGWLWGREAHLVPLEQVAELSEYGVRLKLPASAFEQLPRYEPPASDAQIAASFQRSLETDPRTREAGLRVDVRDGVVRFSGATVDEVMMKTARAIARRIRGVIGFADEVAELPAPPLRIGAPVYARDGRFGTLAKVVVDPHARRVTHLVVRQGWLLTEDRVIPIERVARAASDGVYLDSASTDLDGYPRYREESFIEPLADWEELEPYLAADTLFWGGPYIGVAPPAMPAAAHTVPAGVPEGEIVLRRGDPVFYDDGLVGSLDHVLINPTSGAMTHLVVEEHETNRRVIAPAEWICEIQPGSITLERWNPYQPGVPAFTAARDDAEIAADLSARLQADPAFGAVQAQVDRSVAQLSGNVATIADKATADTLARATPGVIDIENAISADTALFGRITAALADDRRTALVPIEVIVDRGVVTLRGTVPTPAIKEAAEAIARRQTGVVTVVNELEIRHEEPIPALIIGALPH